jgi:uncharacterized protein YjbI with pentapeptide repeats
MNAEDLQEMLDDHRLWLNNEGGSRANLHDADLGGADLHDADLGGADLHGADLHDANLSRANLRGADLHDADLGGADLHGADLHDANLSRANLRGADMGDANLHGANLHGADLDFSCLPLRCGGLRLKIDRRIAAQLAYHFCSMECDDPEFIRARSALLDFANTFHRVNECGKLLPEAEKEAGK